MSTRPRSTPLGVEQLEDRQMMDAGLPTPTILLQREFRELLGATEKLAPSESRTVSDSVITPDMRREMGVEAQVLARSAQSGMIAAEYDSSGKIPDRSWALGVRNGGRPYFVVYGKPGSGQILEVETVEHLLVPGKPQTITGYFKAPDIAEIHVDGVKVPVRRDSGSTSVPEMGSGPAQITVTGVPGDDGKPYFMFDGEVRGVRVYGKEKPKPSPAAVDAAFTRPQSKVAPRIEASPPAAPFRTEASLREEITSLGKRKAEIDAELAKKDDALVVVDGSTKPAGNGNIVFVDAKTVAPMLKGGTKITASFTLSSVRFGVIASQYGDERAFFLGVTDGGELRAFAYGKAGKFGGNTVGAKLQPGVRYELSVSYDPAKPEVTVTLNGKELRLELEDSDRIGAINEISEPMAAGALSDRRLPFAGVIHELALGLLSPRVSPAQRATMTAEAKMVGAKLVALNEELRNAEIGDVRGKLSTVRAAMRTLNGDLLAALREYAKSHPEALRALDEATLLRALLEESGAGAAETREVTGRFAFAVERDDGAGTVTLRYRNAVAGWMAEVEEGDPAGKRPLHELQPGGGEHQLVIRTAKGVSVNIRIRDDDNGRMMNLPLDQVHRGSGKIGWQEFGEVPATMDGRTREHDLLFGAAMTAFPPLKLSALSTAQQEQLGNLFGNVAAAVQSEGDLALLAKKYPRLFGETELIDQAKYRAKIEEDSKHVDSSRARENLNSDRKLARQEFERGKQGAKKDFERWLLDTFFVAGHELAGESPRPFFDALKAVGRGMSSCPALYAGAGDAAPLFGKMMEQYLLVLGEKAQRIAGPVSPAVRAEAMKVLESQDKVLREWKSGRISELVAIGNGDLMPTGDVAFVLGHARGALAAVTEVRARVAANVGGNGNTNSANLGMLARLDEAKLSAPGVQVDSNLGELKGKFPVGISTREGMTYTYRFSVARASHISGRITNADNRGIYRFLLRDESGKVLQTIHAKDRADVSLFIGKPGAYFLTAIHDPLFAYPGSTISQPWKGMDFKLDLAWRDGMPSKVEGTVERKGGVHSVKLIGFGGVNVKDKIIEKEIVPTKPTWIVVHGMNSTPDSFKDLLTSLDAMADRYGYQVLVVNWEDAAKSSLGLGSDARWTSVIGQWVAQQLQILGIKAVDTFFAGHSHGTYVSHDAAKYILDTTGQKVGTIVALDPAGNSPPISGRSTLEINFRKVARRSWAIESSIIAGDNRLASTADISIHISSPLTAIYQIPTEHRLPAVAFVNLLQHEARVGMCDTEISRHFSMPKLLGLENSIQYQRNVYKGTYEAILTVGVEKNGSKIPNALPLLFRYRLNDESVEHVDIQVCKNVPRKE